jgi:hypothetical protein
MEKENMNKKIREREKRREKIQTNDNNTSTGTYGCLAVDSSFTISLHAVNSCSEET